ncbi:MAG: anti-sigma factor antagonist [Acinetobacter sp.]|nr:anti-sigma factor antagonist [Acinetobacter sp.]
MTINLNVENDNCKLAIEGEMTIFVAAEFLSAIQEPVQKNLNMEIDLSQVTEIDSAGLQLMIFVKKKSVLHAFDLHFVNHSKPVQEILELTDLGSFFGDPIVLQTNC